MESIFESSFYTKSALLSRSTRIVTQLSPATLLLIAIITTALYVYQKRRSRFIRLIDKIPGPPGLPLIGNTIEINVEHDDLFSRLISGAALFSPTLGVVKGWMGQMPWVILYRPEVAEPILGSPRHIDKSQDYNFLRPWLGTGLLTSFGHKWHSRRKILTPAFHFKILEDFLDVFNEQSSILVAKLSAEKRKDYFNIFPYVTLCTLDIVCETAMGRQVNAQKNSDSDYVKAVYEIGSIVLNRQSKIWLQPDFIFRWTKLHKAHERCLEILHGFSNRVIRERKDEIKRIAEQNNNNNSDNSDQELDNNNTTSVRNSNLQLHEDVVFGKKKRLAFLDLLIAASHDGKVLSNEDIREEVDTFMFEGHDTTSAAISWTLFLLGSNMEAQRRVAEELEDIFGNDKTRNVTMKDLNEMKYLECCIKEALRLYPSVPLIARQINEDVKIDKYTIPAGTTAMIVTYMLHRDPESFPKPEQYVPERFLPENCYGRHPYAYIPFSAGPRNCIGQKFAIMEEKVVISSVLRHFKVEAVDRREDLTLLGELILRPKDGIKMKITPRT